MSILRFIVSTLLVALAIALVATIITAVALGLLLLIQAGGAHAAGTIACLVLGAFITWSFRVHEWERWRR